MIFPSSQLDRAGYYLFDRLFETGVCLGKGLPWPNEINLNIVEFR